MRRYPHHDCANPAPHTFIALFMAGSDRSHVLKAQGVKHSSAARLTLGSAKIPCPASLHPAHPLHSTKLQNNGFPLVRAA
eukprot:CAMPEP_0194039790 /NCGR_PEP_ID=MMETSP0009_2-20130614/11889_1 /TAXON_ID=210454 /ORGANISM="Grammatophora oceanica, Strain CCMP 410" /LENGTH=79 /DNA_ID=CAMNT_0038682735 /DNA_START=275 /DNA_END=510 /DNA_ORIENTATION=-